MKMLRGNPNATVVLVEVHQTDEISSYGGYAVCQFCCILYHHAQQQHPDMLRQQLLQRYERIARTSGLDVRGHVDVSSKPARERLVELITEFNADIVVINQNYRPAIQRYCGPR